MFLDNNHIMKAFTLTLLLAMVCLTLGGCQYLRIPVYDTIQYVKTGPTLWQLEIGGYKIQGEIKSTAPNRWHFYSYTPNSFAMNNSIYFNQSGITEIEMIADKKLAYYFSDKLISEKNSLITEKILKSLFINDANYAHYECSVWQMQVFKFVQVCDGPLAHKNEMVKSWNGQPVELTIWLPYLEQTLSLYQL
tara:strand:- start:16249 stop:16824 length:576 start_codon:yes stop_codon:yes gene_type:complete